MIATRVEAIPGIIEEGVTGHLVTRDDPGGLAHVLAELACDRPRLARMSAAARASAEVRFDGPTHYTPLARVIVAAVGSLATAG